MSGGAVRGAVRIGDPRVWGTFIGAAGGTDFVLTSRSDLDAPWPGIALALLVVALTAYVVLVLVVPRQFAPPAPVRPSAGRVYLGSVVGMLALIRVGSIVLDHQGRSGLQPALIVAAVGLHFLPFASAFHTPLFRVLGSAMAVIGALGLGAGWNGGDRAAAWAAVVAGLLMIVLITLDAAATRSVVRHEA